MLKNFQRLLGAAESQNILPPKFLIDVYYSLIYSHLCYYMTSWGCALKTRLMPLTKLQKRAVRIITNKRYKDHINPLFLDCKLLKIAEIYKLELSKLMFKVHKNILTISDSILFIPVSTVHHYHTRYRAENFHRKQISKQYMKKSIEISRPIIWSEVPKEIKQFSFSKLKKSLKDHFLRIYKTGIG